MASSAPTSEVVDLVQQLIRNKCVNDGTPGSGDEVRNADLIEAHLAGSGLDVERFDSAPGRSNLIAASRAPTRMHRRCAFSATPTSFR